MELAKERIYVGGLNPPRLSAKDILRRLKFLNQIEIESASVEINENDNGDSSDEDEYNKPYLHITAVSKHNSDSALSVISKQYHNVKWKGCKLVVEKAKPNFLQRLEEERNEQRAKVQEEVAQKAAAEIAETEEQVAFESRIPRRLRVRKKYGDTAVHVDTKPWTVESWSRFDKARSKLQKREEKYSSNLVAQKNTSKDERITRPSGPLMHRSVHIRFETEANGNGNSSQLGGSDMDRSEKMVCDSDSSSSGSLSSDSGSDSGDLSSESMAREKQSEKYDWSDGDSDSDSHTSEKENNNIPDDDSQSTSELLMNQEHNKVLEKQKNDNTYQWSTDEESSDEDDDRVNERSTLLSRNKPLRAVSGTEEFAAGFDDTSSIDEDKDEEPLEGDGQTRSPDDETDLIGDVSANLNILSSIFPDMADAKPVTPNDKDPVDSGNTDVNGSSNAIKKDHIAGYRIMPRYDPTAKSSSQYVVEEEPSKDDEVSNSEMDSASKQESEGGPTEDDESDSVSADENNKSGDEKENPVAEGIYEQDKLENVFRDARDAWGTEDKSVPTETGTALVNDNQTSSSKTSGFSFGFDFDNNDNQSEKTTEKNAANGSFSFSFNVPEVDRGDSQATKAKPSSNTKQAEVQNNELVDASVSSPEENHLPASEDNVDMIGIEIAGRKRCKGLSVPEKELSSFVDNFYACNDGMRIMQDPEGFRNDDNVKAAWNKERQTLTLDWKRKRKYAITRIQKRMKTGRR